MYDAFAVFYWKDLMCLMIVLTCKTNGFNLPQLETTEKANSISGRVKPKTENLGICIFPV